MVHHFNINVNTIYGDFKENIAFTLKSCYNNYVELC